MDLRQFYCKEKYMRALTILTLSTFLVPLSAFGHGGHGADSDSSPAATATHYLTEPQHAAVIGAVLLCIGVTVTARYVVARRRRCS